MTTKALVVSPAAARKPTSDAVRLARIEKSRAIDEARLRLAGDLLKNPVIELIGAFVLVEALQRFPQDRPIIGNLQGNLLEAALSGIIGIQQLAPSLPYIADAGSKVLESTGNIIGKLGPAVGALAAL